MALELPSGLDAAVTAVLGSDWPDGNEDRLFDLGEAWIEVVTSLYESMGDFYGADGEIRAAWIGGAASEAFAGSFEKLNGENGPLIQSANAATELSTMSFDTGVDIQHAKYVMILELIMLAYEIAMAIYTAFFTGGATVAAIAGLKEASKLVIKKAVKELVEAVAQRGLKKALTEGLQQAGKIAASQARGMVTKQAAISLTKTVVTEGAQEVVEEVGMDLVAQAAQIGQGTRGGFDGGSLADSARGGAAGGAGAGAFVAGTRRRGRDGELLSGGDHNPLTNTAGGLATEVGAEVAGEAGAAGAFGQPLDLDDMGGAAGSGAISGGATAGPNAITDMKTHLASGSGPTVPSTGPTVPSTGPTGTRDTNGGADPGDVGVDTGTFGPGAGPTANGAGGHAPSTPATTTPTTPTGTTPGASTPGTTPGTTPEASTPGTTTPGTTPGTTTPGASTPGTTTPGTTPSTTTPGTTTPGTATPG
ncbi:MAG: hypothetical protein ACFCVF_16780, partial [Kineosporiaceae bacterium]